MNCKICRSSCNLLFNTLVLQKYNVNYFQCTSCGFIQTEEPYWLNEAYNDVIAQMDIGLVSRNLEHAIIAEKIINKCFDSNRKFIDYGGGYGLFVRLMRDQGYNFYRQDNYCENIFASFFDVTDITNHEEIIFELLTSFEVFEHLTNPITDILKMFEYSESILFSTELQPLTKITSVNDWWYFVPETGQHISFYTLKSLQYIAATTFSNLYSNCYTF